MVGDDGDPATMCEWVVARATRRGSPGVVLIVLHAGAPPL